MKKRFLGCIFLFCALTTLPALAAEKQSQQALTFAVVPQQSAKKLAKLWTPLLKEISATSGVELVFTTAPNIPIFEQRLERGEYDFAYMNPYHFTVFNQTAGYHALAKQRNKSIQGIIVVKQDSPITTLQQLENLTLAFPAPAAFAATLLPKADLQAQNILIESRYVSSHDSVYLAVARGLLPAGGGIMRTFNNAPEQVRDSLRVLWKTKAHTPHAIASHMSVPLEVRERVLQSLLSLDKTKQGKGLLKTINFSAFESAEDNDWDDIRALGIKTL
ncbi:phosphonate ABC transporter, periplasmic phosphonate-binding protein [Paraglaciecola sp. T6c]|uniref:phosphate/phosphite/phosphonate ABC transporter substrate-binding protein n=1 Tax=Pseudoalteromonas atlantica (strain T6c / ATCC BAA-1087) TaxID=3042615 RepID=UPI00005C6EE8|nr:phosphate/phosphite/phosphonate ABC transporter substrate-binding protein [Paraglaciecola sp. T6c]ABG40058.1 phosphonate ABC transporter, periplasmic phosphonate-binding protein [Paraglaciecola sp. T6c]